jgi:hypothetical protein
VNGSGAIDPTLDDLANTGAEIWFFNGEYLVRNQVGRYVVTSKEDLKHDLEHLGFDPRRPRGGGRSPVEELVRLIRTERAVDYAGPYAGRRCGLCVEQGRQILVTEECTILPASPAPGDWPTIKALLSGMLDGDGDGVQLTRFLSWLKVSRDSLESGRWTPGQAVALAGPRNCGKSLLQAIVVQVLGGRSASPYSVMTGQSRFSSHLFRAENLCFGDEISADTGIGARREFGAALKRITVNETQECEAKGKEPITLRPWWRVTFSINDEPENLLVLPPLDESIVDKIMGFRVSRPAMFDGPNWSDDRGANWAKIEAELPFFLYDLKRFEIPADIRDRRFVVRSFVHPSLTEALGELSPEQRLLDLIDAEYFVDGAPLEITETAIQIETRLRANDSRVRQLVGNLFNYNKACGSYLGRLSTSRPERVSKAAHAGGIQQYTVVAPQTRATERRGNKTSIRPETAFQHA